MKYLTPISFFLFIIFICFIYELINNISEFHILAGIVLLLYAIYLFAIDRVLYAILKSKQFYFWILELLIISIIVMIKWWYKLNFLDWILIGF